MKAEEVEEYLSLNPDAFTRFFICKEILKKSFNKDRVEVLDVGGGSKYFYQALELDKLPYQLTVIDILPPKVKHSQYSYVQGDATKMEFKDDSFDAVVSMDVLEHIPDEKKVSFINECYRVAKDLVVIAGPFAGIGTDEAEHLANDYYKSLHGQDHPWLVEHFEQNKPEQKMIEKEISRLGCSFIRFESNSLSSWLELILPNFTPENLIDPAKLKSINRFYNDNLLKLNDFDEPGYRWFYVLYKNPKLAKKFEDYFKLESSIKEELQLKLKLTQLFTSELVETSEKLHKAAHLKAKADEEHRRLLAELNNTRVHARNLEAVIESIQGSKSFKFAQSLDVLRRKLKGKG